MDVEKAYKTLGMQPLAVILIDDASLSKAFLKHRNGTILSQPTG